MHFEYIEKNKRVSDAELINDIKAVALQLNKDSLSIAEYSKFGSFDPSTPSRRFGTWNAALNCAGLKPRNSFHNEQELLDNLYSVWIKKGEQPTRDDMDNHGLSFISSGSYLRRYGSWSKALIAFIEYMNESDALDNKEASVAKTIRRTPHDINLRLRFNVIKRDHFKCCVCGASPSKDPSVVLHVDHIIPYSKGGETVIENLQTLCSKCNLGKGNLTISDS